MSTAALPDSFMSWPHLHVYRAHQQLRRPDANVHGVISRRQYDSCALVGMCMCRRRSCDTTLQQQYLYLSIALTCMHASAVVLSDKLKLKSNRYTRDALNKAVWRELTCDACA